MDFSKLSSNEKLATYGAVAAIIAGLVSAFGGLLFLSVLGGIAMLAVIFLPQFSPATSLPGSKGSLMLIAGGVAGVAALLTLLTWISFIGLYMGSLGGILFLVAVVGSLVMAWAGWQAFQAEGGKFTLGSTAAHPNSTPASTPASTPPAAPIADEHSNTPPSA